MKYKFRLSRRNGFGHLIVSLISSISLFSHTSTCPVRKQWLTKGTSWDKSLSLKRFILFYLAILGHHRVGHLHQLPPFLLKHFQLCNTAICTCYNIDGNHVEQNVPVKQFCQMLRHFWRVIPVGKNIQQVGGGGKIEPFKEDWKDKLKREHLGNASLFVSRYSASAFSHFDKLCISSSSFSESPSALVAFTTFGVFAISTMRTLKSLSTMSNRLESSGSWARMSSDPMKIDSR